MKITLPYPPSANRYWRAFRGRTVVSAEARSYKRQVAKACKAAGFTEPLAGEVAISVIVYRPILRGDLGNRLKVLEDALNGFAWHDDEQVSRIYMERHLDRKEPRVEVEVTAAPTVKPVLTVEPDWNTDRMRELLGELRGALDRAEPRAAFVRAKLTELTAEQKDAAFARLDALEKSEETVRQRLERLATSASRPARGKS